MIAKKIIDNLKTNLAEAGSQIAGFTDHHIMFMLDEARATLASRKMDAKVNVIQMIQPVDVVPIDATRTEMGTIGDKKVLKLVIPDPIAYLNGGGIMTVGPTDGTESYSRITYSQIRTALYRKYTGKAPKWFFHENAIYIVNADSEMLQKIRVRGIWDQPYLVEIAMKRYKYLDPFNWEYPLSMKDLNTVYQLAMAGDLGWGDIATQSIQAQKVKQKKDGQLLQALKSLGNAQTQQEPV
ncbi:hypothetical protein LCGC14_0984220 [marine sediment metagenome]|uniref:Uncharacterized protein n=1 Tax=marine sediment metagenome TaxID=412755 RepID=A0A0F9QR12_9ZZZZ|nr:hypothetical protein [Bacteroides sp.]